MSDLCLDCGICCTTLFFTTVRLYDEDMGNLPSQITPERRSDKLSVFPLPCVAHKDYKCTVYTQRPQTCRSYECNLLIDQKAGRIEIGLARQIVAETKRRYEAVERYLAPLGQTTTYLPHRVLDLAHKAESDPASNQLPDQFVKDAHELAELMRWYFKRRYLPPTPDTDDADVSMNRD
jgi:Fe-S-cluster containining protein